MHAYNVNRISLKEARGIVLGAAIETGEEEIDFGQALSRVLSRDVTSGMNSPPFDRAMMDGYAIISADTQGASASSPARLRLVGGVAIGEHPTLTLKRGEVVRIMTGAPVPLGADTVLRVEHSKEAEGWVEVIEPVPIGRDISPMGEDVGVGDVILRKGRLLVPHDLGVLAATGNLRVWVKKKPKISVVSTGSELIEPGGKLRPGSIYDINTYTLGALVKDVGGNPILQDIIRDDEAALERLLGSSWDALIISGATSVGEKDFVPDVIERQGEVLFHGVRIRPGSPAGFGRIDGRPVFMLPGFPVSAIAAFEHFVAPFIQKSLGREIRPRHNQAVGTLDKPIPSQKGRVDFVRVRVKEGDEGFIVSPITAKGSSLISTLSKADGFVLVDEEKEGLEHGEKVKVYLF